MPAVGSVAQHGQVSTRESVYSTSCVVLTECLSVFCLFCHQLIAASGSHPYIPFYPVHKRDLTFLALATPTIVEQLINFDKFRSLSREIRHLLASANDRSTSSCMMTSTAAAARYPYGFVTSSGGGGATVAERPTPAATEQSAKKLFAQQMARKKASHYLKAAMKVRHTHNRINCN